MVEVIDRDHLGFRVSEFRVLGFVPDKQGVIAYYFVAFWAFESHRASYNYCLPLAST